MAYTTINKGSSYFNTKLYTGTGASNSVTGVGFAPDFVWIKNRDNGGAFHRLVDTVRGATKLLYSNGTNAEDTDVDSLTSFNVDGFTVGSGAGVNQSGSGIVSWNWLANGAGVSNTQGTVTSTVSANTTAGFSIVSLTATSGTSSIGHGLGVAPSMIILKTRNQTGNWITGLAVNGWDKYLTLDTTNANVTDDRMFSPSAGTDPTSTLFWSNQAAIGSAGTMIAYCFAEVKGYSKFGSYTGNGSTDGTFVYTGFKPAFVIFKRSSSTGNWQLYDNKRLGYNAGNNNVQPNLSNAESTASDLDILSNGFKLRVSGTDANGSGSTYIYMAFAENPFVTSTQIPTTAR